jgi:hypothetical protein
VFSLINFHSFLRYETATVTISDRASWPNVAAHVDVLAKRRRSAENTNSVNFLAAAVNNPGKPRPTAGSGIAPEAIHVDAKSYHVI